MVHNMSVRDRICLILYRISRELPQLPGGSDNIIQKNLNEAICLLEKHKNLDSFHTIIPHDNVVSNICKVCAGRGCPECLPAETKWFEALQKAKEGETP